jgi:DNA-binding MarR family transcriptional regulator
MKPEEVKELEILNELSKGEHTTQRALSRRLGIALGLTNAFIKRLTRKGYIKITTLPRNRIKYLLTPKGFLEKSRLTLEYIQYSYSFYREARKSITAYLTSLKKRSLTRIAIVGTGELAELTYLSMQEVDLEPAAVIDDAKRGRKFFGKEIVALHDVSRRDVDRILVSDANLHIEPDDEEKEKFVYIGDICK